MQLFGISIENPKTLLLILLIIPALFLLFHRFHKATSYLPSSYKSKNNHKFSIYNFLTFSFTAKILLRSLAWIFIVVSLSEISWGTKKIQIHKTGSNVNLVFDISYSMLAQDAQAKKTRLEAAKLYALSLINHLPDSSFSLTLAKGAGFSAIPETEDRALLESTIESLTPKIMSSTGSSLGKGIEKAISSIPKTSSKSQYIFVFTDGDETDNLLEKACDLSLKSGISTTIIGFGSENETKILTGDGKNFAKTALRSQKLKELCDKVNKKNLITDSNSTLSVSYVDSKEKGSAWILLDKIQQNKTDENYISYEVENINHHTLFTLLAICCIILSFIVSEFNFGNIKNLKNYLFSAIVICSVFSFVSCSSEKKQILEGVFSWYEGKYTSATADFFNATETSQIDSIAHDYALYDLGSTYLSMSENEAALERYNEINIESAVLPEDLKSRIFYNMGIIYERKNDFEKAAEYFKLSILSNPANLNAKINLELCNRDLVQKQVQNAQSMMQKVSEEKSSKSDMNTEIFTMIRETEGKKWRNMGDGDSKENDELDY